MHVNKWAKLNCSVNETVSSGENRIPLLSILGIERKESNRYVERILSLLRAAIGTRSSEGLKNSITRYESVTGIEPKLRGAHTPAETDRRNERRYRVCTTGPLAGCTNIFSSGCYEWLAIIDAVVGLPTTPAGKSSDSRGNGHVETRACYRSYARRSQPRLFIIGRATVTRSAILDSTDVALTLLNNLDMFTIL